MYGLALTIGLMALPIRAAINPFVFSPGGFIAFVVALLTIAYHTVRSARANPTKALRYE